MRWMFSLVPEQRPSERIVRPEQRTGDVLRELRRLVLVHPDFLLDHAPLALDLGGGKRRAQEHVGEHIDHERRCLALARA
jgi:hypothetical protein